MRKRQKVEQERDAIVRAVRVIVLILLVFSAAQFSEKKFDSIHVRKSIFLPSAHDSVGEGIIFLGCLSVCLFFRLFVCLLLWTDLVTMIYHERPQQSRWNL